MRGLVAAVGCALATASCGYPEFHFDEPGDAPIADSSIDEGSEVAIDSSIDAHLDADARVDVVTDSAIESTSDADADAAAETEADSTTDSGVGVDSVTEVVAETVAEADADATDPCLLIDDMEDGDAVVLVRCGRRGNWFTFNDATSGASQTPAPTAVCLPTLIPGGGRGTSLYAMRTYGSGFTTWGAGIGFNFINSGPSYDVSSWHGVTFWAHVATGTTTSVRFDFPDVDTDARGGVCSTTSPGCGDHFGVAIALTTTWTLYTIRFTDLAQEGWGHVASAFNPAKVYGMQLQTSASATFDIWIDDVSFLP
jgi:hypothetical protein